MGQKALLGLAVLLLLAAATLGVVGATRGGVPAVGTRWPGGMMGGYGGMMGGYGAARPGSGSVTIDQAQSQVEQYIRSYGGSDLSLDEVIEFRDNYYAIVKERSTGIGAFELLVSRATGAVSPEPGPNMMWNTRYGMMRGTGMMGRAGMMGGWAQPTSAMTVSADRAGQIAQSWLDSNQPGARIEEPDAFYGYFTVHFKKDGKVAGMLSVNGYTGQVWYHDWHGAFVQERQVGS